MFYDSFDMGNPDQRVIPDHDANRVMTTTKGMMFVNTLIPGKKPFFPGELRLDRKVGTAINIATVMDGAVTFSTGFIAPRAVPPEGFFLEGGATAFQAQEWGAWIAPPPKGATTLIWPPTHVAALTVTSEGEVEIYPSQRVRITFTHDIVCWVVGEVVLTEVNGSIKRVTKLVVAAQAPPKGKKARRVEESTAATYTPPEVVVESPFAVLLKRK